MFEVGDYVVCINGNKYSDVTGVIEGCLYVVSKVNSNTLRVVGIAYTWLNTRFRKVKKVPDTKITRLLCKVYKEEDGYLYI